MAYLFQTHLRGVGGGAGEVSRDGGLNLAKTIVFVLHKELEYKVKKL